MMKTTVVLSTYNGEKYILEQLDSLRQQTRAADQVLIRDDCSTDATVQIVTDYIQRYSLDSWSITVGETNIGWKKNFYKLLKKATGDIIFPCDQDDIWHKDKIEKMTNIMETNDKILLLVSNYTPFYEENGNVIPIDASLQDNSEKVFVPQSLLNNWLLNKRPGCVYAVNKKLLPYFFEVHQDDDSHDGLLWRLAYLLDGLYLFAHSTIDFRRHDSNATGNKERSYSHRKKEIIYYSNLMNRLRDFARRNRKILPVDRQELVDRYYAWASYRENLYINKKIHSWVQLFPYRHLYWSFKTYIADLVIFFKRKEA